MDKGENLVVSMGLLVMPNLAMISEWSKCSLPLMVKNKNNIKIVFVIYF